MSKLVSPFYPPRARWYSRLYYLGLATRQRLALDRIQLPEEITALGLVLGFLIPGLAVCLRGPRRWGEIALSACALLFLLFIVWLGYPAGNYAFGMMLSIHASGFVYYCAPVLRNGDFWRRMLFTVAVLAALGLGIYAPIRNEIQDHWLTPLRVNGNVVIVKQSGSPDAVRRGDWVAYNLSGSSDYGDDSLIRFQTGVGFGPVLATGGDFVAFSTNGFSVNGVSRPLMPHMPQSGGLTVPKSDWFIWPSYSIRGRGNEDRVSSRMLQMATVPEDQFIGRPLKRWLWRKQILQ
jgi:hypothetical protein